MTICKIYVADTENMFQWKKNSYSGEGKLYSMKSDVLINFNTVKGYGHQVWKPR